MAVVRAVIIIPAWPPPKVKLHQFLAVLSELLAAPADAPATASQHLNEVHVTFRLDGPADDAARTKAAGVVQAALARVHPGQTTVQVTVAPDARPDAIDLRPSGDRVEGSSP